MITAALREHDPSLHERGQVLWGGGEAVLTGRRSSVPAIAGARIRYSFAYDANQRGKAPDNAWPSVFLPGVTDPDTMCDTVARTLGGGHGGCPELLVVARTLVRNMQ
jgi:hypothetical protein